jgi:hypothetical protein
VKVFSADAPPTLKASDLVTPTTSSFVVGVVVPTPTLPGLVLLMLLPLVVHCP